MDLHGTSADNRFEQGILTPEVVIDQRRVHVSLSGDRPYRCTAIPIFSKDLLRSNQDFYFRIVCFLHNGLIGGRVTPPNRFAATKDY